MAANEGSQGVMGELELVFGENSSPELVVASQHVTKAQRDELIERVTTWGRRSVLPVCQQGTLRPLLGAGWKGLLQQIAIGYGDLQDGPRIAGLLRHFLLYSNELALAEPLSGILAQDFGVFKNFLPTTVAAMVDLDPLVRAGVIHWVYDLDSVSAWRTASYPSGWTPDEGFYEGLFEIAQYAPPPTNVSAVSLGGYGDLTPEQKRRIVMVNFARTATNDLFDDLRTLERHHGRADLVIANDFEAVIFEYLSRQGIAPWAEQPEASLYAPLLRVSLPSLDQLDDRDIVTIRSSDPGFARWREVVSRFLVASDETDGAKRAASMDSVRSDLLQLLSDSRRESLGGRMVSGMRDFSIAALSSAIGAAVFNSLSMATVAGVTGLAGKTLLSAFTRRDEAGVARALGAHATILGPAVRGGSSKARERLTVY